jgi:7-carboxy-7-deazaguanine synthase
MEMAAKTSQSYVVLTGGELLEQDTGPLLARRLSFQGLFILLETSGQFYAVDVFDKCNLLSVDIKPPSSGIEARMDIIQSLVHRFEGKSQFKVYEFIRKVYQRLD